MSSIPICLSKRSFYGDSVPIGNVNYQSRHVRLARNKSYRFVLIGADRVCLSRQPVVDPSTEERMRCDWILSRPRAGEEGVARGVESREDKIGTNPF